MKVSKQRKKEIERIRKRAKQIYKKGFSLEETRVELLKEGIKRSRAWVGLAVH